MAFNGSGAWNLPAGQPVVTGQVISSTTQNTLVSDIASSFGTVICKDGQTTVTANLPMATYKHTGVGAATAATDYARYDQVQTGAPVYLASVAGTNTITASATPTPAYTVGQVFRFTPAATNTAATTLNISSLGAGAVQSNGQALVGGELVINVPTEVIVSAATPVFQIINSAPFLDSRPLVVGATDQTKKLRFEVDGFTTATTRVATLPDADITVAALNVADQALTGGVVVTSLSLGTVSSGTTTPDPGDRPLQHYTNNGAHTLGVSANAGSIILDITNGASAGAITTSAFTKVSGDSFTTTNGNKFRCQIVIGNAGSTLNVQAMQ